MDDSTKDFYDKESAYYSDKRYSGPLEGYIQYIFRKRLALFLSLLKRVEKELPKDATILEIGCADGVVFKAIEKKFPGRFAKLVGIDVSPKMIEEAKRRNNNPRAAFEVRDEKPLGEFDVVIELGVHPYDIDAEMSYVTNHLKKEGRFLYDMSGSESLYRRIKLREAAYADDYKPYRDYEALLRKYFSVEAEIPFGLFVPMLWRFPSLGRNIQTLIDGALRRLLPDLFQEKLYLLKKRRESGFDK